MFNRKWLYIFTFITLTISITINYFFPFAGLWMLFLLPIFGIILLYPNWLVGNLSILIMITIRYLTQYAAFSGKIPIDFLGRLVTTSIAAWIIIIIVTFFILKMNSLFEQLQQLSLTDNLTGSYNRRYLELYSEKLFANAWNESRPLSLLVFDIDHFKHINDTFGHKVGDMILKKITVSVQRLIRESDILVRLGGDEFTLLMPDTELQHGIKKAEKIREAVEAFKFEDKGTPIRVTISTGILQYTDETLEQLIEKADQALYTAKKKGRNRVSTVK